MERHRPSVAIPMWMIFPMAGLFAIACRESFDNPFSPGSPGYAGEAWSRDQNGDGVSDSLAKYLPGCSDGPETCLSNAKALSAVWDKPRTLACPDAVLRLGGSSAGLQPVFTPPELALRGWSWSSSDTAKLRTDGTRVFAKALGYARLKVRLREDSLSASCMVRVVSGGKPVQSLTAADLHLKPGDDGQPILGWLPANAEYRDYSLTSQDPAAAIILDNHVRAVRSGSARIVARAWDGGAQATFTVSVEVAVKLPDTLIPPDTIVHPDTLVHTDTIPDPNQAPTAAINTPLPFNPSGGQVVAFSGTGTDPEEGNLNANACMWRAALVRTKAPFTTTVFFGPVSGRSGSFTVPSVGETSPDFLCRLYLTVRDSLGLKGNDSLDLAPATAAMALLSNPPGLLLILDGNPVSAPFLFTAVPGVRHQIEALSPQRSGGKNYAFAGWSDGLPVSHAFAAPAAGAALTAAFSTLVDSVAVAAMGLTVGGKDKAPEITWFPADASDRRVTLRSLDTTVASIANGMVHAVAAGNADIALATLDGARIDTFQVAVLDTTPPSSLLLTAKLRDFREIPDQSQFAPPAWSHPDFNNDKFSTCEATGYVDSLIALDGAVDSSAFKSDNRTPKLIRTTRASDGKACYTSAARFEEWYNDKDTSLNRPFLMDLRFSRLVTGMYEFSSPLFFPLDNPVTGTWYNLPGKNLTPYGHLSTGPDAAHNFGFTLELHAGFTYKAGAGQVFNFTGDDDAWVYINGKLAVDLGGIHGPQSASVSLDARAAALGLVNNKFYPLDFFFAERHVNGSSCAITTNLPLVTR